MHVWCPCVRAHVLVCAADVRQTWGVSDLQALLGHYGFEVKHVCRELSMNWDGKNVDFVTLTAQRPLSNL